MKSNELMALQRSPMDLNAEPKVMALVQVNDERFIWQRAAVTSDNPLHPSPVLIYPEKPAQTFVKLIPTKAGPVSNSGLIRWCLPTDPLWLAKKTPPQLKCPLQPTPDDHRTRPKNWSSRMDIRRW